MQDEHFMRGWNEGHDRFSADIAHGLQRLAAPFQLLGERIARIRRARQSPLPPLNVQSETE